MMVINVIRFEDPTFSKAPSLGLSLCFSRHFFFFLPFFHSSFARAYGSDDLMALDTKIYIYYIFQMSIGFWF